MGGLFDAMDDAISYELGVGIQTYIRECTQEEADFIILTILEEDKENLQKAKRMFNKYLDDQN